MLLYYNVVKNCYTPPLANFSFHSKLLASTATSAKFPICLLCRVLMGVIDFYNSAALCWVKSNTNLKQQVGLSPKPICSFEGNQRKFVAMASTIPVEQVNNGPLQVTGDSFIREHLRKLSPYQPILPFEVLSARLGRKPEDIVKLDANENPYGPPPEVMEALGSIKFPYVYPDPESRRLRAALAQDSGLEAEYILAGCGADELIDLIMRCVLDPGDKIVDCPPTFTMYEFDAAVNGALVIKVPRKPDFSLNVEQIAEVVKQEKPKCIFLTSPNNPDGSIIDDDVLLKILDLPILVILDEAYIEFSAIESRMSWVKKHENLIVLRTFSKRAGLAGLRVGYGAFPLSIIEFLWRAKQPYNVSVAAEISACAALQNPTYLENVKNALLKERGRLYDLLKEVPFLRPFPSHSNFILCEVTSGKDAKKLKEDLAQMGVMIRHYDKKELKGYVRVTVGKPEQTDALMKCLKKLS
ncbi:histidinol-phosphate aminotransferase [Vigna unguiculata]|uniref:histidinol-phosphate transaminase n=1 Tax=Vigna unguiculata TaxID=3917 RepID=A0A4D6LZJ4_VIGUN|nr:histidinol-phosphate aminotransferase [Vigna unguiculata]